jgi:elongation factor G
MNDGFDRRFYRGTVRASGSADEKVVRQLGGKGEYAHVRVAVRALTRGQGAVLAWKAGSNIPAKFAPAVLEGIYAVMNAGVLGGLELTDVHISVDDGSYHDVDSTMDAFREAAETAVTEAVRQAGPIVLEELSLVTITVPTHFVDPVETRLNSLGATTKTTSSETAFQIITASIPMADANKLIAGALEISEGGATISSASAGFRPRPEPPETVEQWVVRR